MLAAIAFYVLAAVAIVSAFAVVAVRNPVHSVLFLILTFFTSAGLFVLLGAEFLAMLLVVVYVGAVAVLFLFVVMMLDVDLVELRQGFLSYLPAGALVALALLSELVLVASAAMSARGAPIALASAAPGVPAYVILHDRTLAGIAQARPASLAALGAVGGIGASRLERYGQALLAVVAGS